MRSLRLCCGDAAAAAANIAGMVSYASCGCGCGCGCVGGQANQSITINRQEIIIERLVGIEIILLEDKLDRIEQQIHMIKVNQIKKKQRDHYLRTIGMFGFVCLVLGLLTVCWIVSAPASEADAYHEI